MGLREGSFALVLLVLCAVWQAEAYRSGDIVQMSKRSRYAFGLEEDESQWSEIMAKQCPRFRAAKAITLSNPVATEAVDLNYDYKLAFSFADRTFITPWITIWDGRTRRLATFIEFIFVYSGNEIKEVRTSVDYNMDEAHQDKVAENIWVSYTWEEYGEQDIEVAMMVLLIGGFTAVLGLMIYIVVDLQLTIMPQKTTNGPSVDRLGDSLMNAFSDLPTLGSPYISEFMQPPIQTVVTPIEERAYVSNEMPPSDEPTSEGFVPMEMGSFVNEEHAPSLIGAGMLPLHSPVASLQTGPLIERTPYPSTAKED